MNNVASTMCYPPYSPDIVRREIYDCLKRYKIHLMKNHWRSYGITSICPNGSFYPNGIYKYPTGGWRNRFINLFSGSTSIVSSHCSYFLTQFFYHTLSLYTFWNLISRFQFRKFFIPSFLCLYSLPLETMLFSKNALLKIEMESNFSFFFLHVSRTSWSKCFFLSFSSFFVGLYRFFGNCEIFQKLERSYYSN